MVLAHSFFALLSELGRNFTEDVLAVPVHVQVIVFEKVETTVCKRARSWANLHHPERHFFAFDLVEHKVGDHVAVVGLEYLAGGHPCVLWVKTLHFLPEVVVASTLAKLDRLPQSAHLVLLLNEVTAWEFFAFVWQPVEPVVDELPEQHLVWVDLFDKGLGLQFDNL